MTLHTTNPLPSPRPGSPPSEDHHDYGVESDLEVQHRLDCPTPDSSVNGEGGSASGMYHGQGLQSRPKHANMWSFIIVLVLFFSIFFLGGCCFFFLIDRYHIIEESWIFMYACLVSNVSKCDFFISVYICVSNRQILQLGVMTPLWICLIFFLAFGWVFFFFATFAFSKYQLFYFHFGLRVLISIYLLFSSMI